MIQICFARLIESGRLENHDFKNSEFSLGYMSSGTKSGTHSVQIVHIEYFFKKCDFSKTIGSRINSWKPGITVYLLYSNLICFCDRTNLSGEIESGVTENCRRSTWIFPVTRIKISRVRSHHKKTQKYFRREKIYSSLRFQGIYSATKTHDLRAVRDPSILDNFPAISPQFFSHNNP